MSYTNETTYYGLPLPTGSDKSTFTDNNTAFQAVDAALHTAAEQSGAATEDLVTVKADIVDLKAADVTMSGDIDAAEINIEALQQKELLQDAAIDAVKADAQDMITAYNEPTATSTHAYSVGDFFIYNDVLYKATTTIAIGDTIVPDTNCSTTNVSSEIKASLIYFDGDTNGFVTVYKIGRLVVVNFSVYSLDIAEKPNGVICEIPLPQTANVYAPVSNTTTEFRAVAFQLGDNAGKLVVTSRGGATINEDVPYISGSFSYICRAD